MSEVTDLIARLPDWVSLSAERWPAEAPALNAAAQKVGLEAAGIDLDAIRAGIQTFAPPSSLNIENAGRLLLFNRLVFAVLEWSDASVGFFGGFIGPKSEGERIQIGWPFDGSGEIVHPFQGYMGDEFQALAEFDRFGERFGRGAWSRGL